MRSWCREGIGGVDRIGLRHWILETVRLREGKRGVSVVTNEKEVEKEKCESERRRGKCGCGSGNISYRNDSEINHDYLTHRQTLTKIVKNRMKMKRESYQE